MFQRLHMYLGNLSFIHMCILSWHILSVRITVKRRCRKWEIFLKWLIHSSLKRDSTEGLLLLFELSSVSHKQKVVQVFLPKKGFIWDKEKIAIQSGEPWQARARSEWNKEEEALLWRGRGSDVVGNCYIEFFLEGFCVDMRCESSSYRPSWFLSWLGSLVISFYSITEFLQYPLDVLWDMFVFSMYVIPWALWRCLMCH